MDKKNEKNAKVIPFEPRRIKNRYLDERVGIWRLSKMIEDRILEEKQKKTEEP